MLPGETPAFPPEAEMQPAMQSTHNLGKALHRRPRGPTRGAGPRGDAAQSSQKERPPSSVHVSGSLVLFAS